uniref:Odorant receptor n=2 Tax=Culex quinquefasciatus TaxID=7176 RepID=A0A1S4KIE3_CULQU
MKPWTQLKNRVDGIVLRTLGLYQRQKPFWLMRYLFAVNGISLELECSVIWRWVWNIHRILIGLHAVIFVVDRFVAAVAADAEFDKKLFHLHLVFIVVVIFVRQLCLTMKFNTVETLRKYTLGNDFRKNDEELQEKRNNTWNHLKKIELVIVVQATVTFIVFTLSNVEKSLSLQFPLDLSGISELLQTVCAHIYSLYYCWLCFAMAINYYSLSALMICLVTELEIVGDAFRKVFAESLQPGQEYRTCCQQHVQFIRMINVFKSLTSELFLLVYCATVSLTAIEIFQVVSTKRLGFYEVFVIQDFCVFYVEFFCFCWLATKMNEMNFRIAGLIYEQEWYREMQYSDNLPKMYRSVKQSLLIVMIFAQQSLGIAVGGIYELSMELFMELLNNSYSLLMFLKEITK